MGIESMQAISSALCRPVLLALLCAVSTSADFCTAYAPMEGSRFTFPQRTCLAKEFLDLEFAKTNFGKEPIRLSKYLRNLSHQDEQGNTHSFPLALEASWGWESGHAVSAVVDILLREVLGVNTEFVCTWGSSHALRLLGGCSNPMGGDSCLGVNGRPQHAVPLAQASIETWVTTAQENEDMLLYGSNLGMVGYQSKSGLFFDATIAAEAFEDAGLSLEWWQVYTTRDASAYFDSYLSISDSVRRWSKNATKPMCLPGTAAYETLQVKGFNCFEGWFFAPSCEDDKESCIPVILAEYSWNALDWIEAAVLHGYRFAVTWIGAQYSAAYGVRSGSRMLFYCPTVTAVCSEKPLAKLFGDDHSPQGRPDYVTRLLKVVWRKLQQVDEEVYTFIQRINFPTEDLTALMASYSDKMVMAAHSTEAIDELVQDVACEWIKNSIRVNDSRGIDTGDNTRKWGLWIPRTCRPGEDYDEASGRCQECAVGEQSPEGKKCTPCSHGTFADKPGTAICKACVLGSWQDGSNRSTCKKCDAGEQRGEKDQGCQACLPGFVSTQPGEAACKPCPLGSWARLKGSSVCSACPASMITPREASTASTDCECAPSNFLPCAAGLDFTACAAAANSTKCRACPEGFHCPGGKETIGSFQRHAQPVLQRGFYATEDEPYQAYLCAEARDACPGVKAGACDGGRYGLQCYACDYSFVGTNGGNCEICDWTKFVRLPLAFLVGFFALALIHHFANQGPSVSQRQRKFLSTNVPLFSYLGLISTYTQLYAVLHSVAVAWPHAFAVLLQYLQFVLLDMTLLSPACYIGGESLTSKYLPGVLLPVFVTTLLLSMYAMVYVLARQTSLVTPMQWNRTLNTLGTVMLGLYVAVVKATVSIFEGRPNPSGPDTLRAYDGFLYMQEDVISVAPIAALSALVYIVGFASLYAYAIIRAPALYQQDRGFKQRYEFLLKRWHPRSYYWGMVFISRNCFCSLVPSMTSDGVLQILLMIAIVLPSTMAQVHVLPWRSNTSNKMDCRFNIALLTTLIAGLACQEPSKSPEVNSALGVMSLAAYLCAVFGTFCIVAQLAIRTCMYRATSQGTSQNRSPPPSRRTSVTSEASSVSQSSEPESISGLAAMAVDSLGIDRGNANSNGTQRKSMLRRGLGNLALAPSSAADDAFKLFYVFKGLQESEELTKDDGQCLLNVLEQLTREIPEKDVDNLQWALKLLAYHLLGDKTFKHGGIMMAPAVHRTSFNQTTEAEVSQIDEAEASASEVEKGGGDKYHDSTA